jgi:hypothetical protein
LEKITLTGADEKEKIILATIDSARPMDGGGDGPMTNDDF